MKTVKIISSTTSISQILGYSKVDSEPICIETEDESAILLSKDVWRDIEETLNLLSIKGMRESLIEGKNTPISECSSELGW
jgi:PHD/YefM family antitoxin component YafN of YafNO toxin-antitoxin module